MGLWKGHPRDGAKRRDYVLRKVEHLRRLGLVAGKNIGLGQNGGAAPDHLVSEQAETERRYRRYRGRLAA